MVKIGNLETSEQLYTVGLVLFLIWGNLYNSMFLYVLPSNSLKILLYSSLLIFLIKMLFYSTYTHFEILLFLFTMCIVFFIVKTTHYNELLFYTVVILASKNIDFMFIIKNYFFTTAFLLLIIILSAKVGIIPDLLNIRDGQIRHGLGTMYSTNLSSKFFSLILSYVFLKDYNLKVFEYLILLAGTAYIYFQTYGRLDTICILVILFMSVTYRLPMKKIKKIIGSLAIFMPFVCFFISYYLSKNFDSMENIYASLDKVMSGRLTLGNVALKQYSIWKIFGQYIYSRGNGGIFGLEGSLNEYFYVDSSYLSILLKYGPIFTLLLFMIFVFKLIEIYKKEYWVLSISLMVIFINAMIADFLYVPFVNPFILVLFCQLPLLKKNDKATVKNLNDSA